MKILVGNLFESQAKTLVNTVNCVGVMGKGIALEFKQKFPAMYKQYTLLCDQAQIKAGVPYLYSDLEGVSIINFPTKDHWKSPSKLSYIVNGLHWFKNNYAKLGITSIAFPPLGCGNGGLLWDVVGPIMYEALNELPIEIEIYAPYGTSPEKLTKEFLAKNSVHSAKDILGNASMKFNPKWLLLLEVVNRLKNSKYVIPVGRTIFQKICYVLTSEGVETGFVFQKGEYGPYAPQVKEAITVLSNANLIAEKQLGRMIAVDVTDRYAINLSNYSEKEQMAVTKTVDLFSRIKSTEQAEIVATVLYSYEMVAKKQNSIKDLAVYDFVLEWKPKWRDGHEEIIKQTINNLAMLNWINVLPTRTSPKDNE